MGFKIWKGDTTIAGEAYSTYLTNSAASGFSAGGNIVAEPNFNAILRQNSLISVALMQSLGITNKSADSPLNNSTTTTSDGLLPAINSAMTLTVNGTPKHNNYGTIYAPTTAGSNGDLLKSNGSGAPSWMSFQSLIDFFYPIGSIYMTTNETLNTAEAMSAHFGGTWEAWGEGKVPVGVGTNYPISGAGSTGGSETRTLTTGQIPQLTTNSTSKDLTGTIASETSGPGETAIIHARSGIAGTSQEKKSATVTNSLALRSPVSGQVYVLTIDATHTHTVGSASPSSIDIRQPYQTCYMWKRTA